jgi:hypothetical protein
MGSPGTADPAVVRIGIAPELLHVPVDERLVGGRCKGEARRRADRSQVPKWMRTDLSQRCPQVRVRDLWVHRVVEVRLAARLAKLVEDTDPG